MIRTEDDLRAVYTDPAGLDEAEVRILDALTTRPLADPVRHRPPARTWLAVAASAAAVIGIVVAAGAVVGHRAHTQPGNAPTIPGPYRHTRVHMHNPGAANTDDYWEQWAAPDGHTWGRTTTNLSANPSYSYGANDLNRTQYPWSAGFLRSLPTDPQKLRTFLIAHATEDLKDADGHVTAMAAGQYLIDTVGSFWKGEGFQYLSPARLAAIVHMLEATPRVKTNHVHDSLGRPALRLDWPVYDGTRSSLLFDPKTFAYLGQQQVGKDPSGSGEEIVEVDETTNTVPKAVVDGAHEYDRTDFNPDKPTPWAQPVTG